ncbi:MAG: pyridoxal-phosphate dependent enzyme [Nitrospinota bacterium]
MAELITLQEIRDAREKLSPLVRRTPLVPFAAGPEEAGRERLFLKLENLQITGAYKPRAAFHILGSLTPAERARGVVMCSSGNFGQAFALAGRELGVRVAVVVMRRASPYKVDAVRRCGGEVVFCENDAQARKPKMHEVARERGMLAIDTTEDRRTPIGHGTVGLEILEDLPGLSAVVVPCSSGGLLAGVASAVKLSNPGVRVVGAQPVGAGAIYHSVRAGEPVTLDRWESMADGLSATRPGDFPFAHIQARVDDVVLVTEEEIARAFRALLFRGKILAEGAGAVAAAACLAGKVKMTGKTVALVSGGNLTQELIQGLVAGEIPVPAGAR